MASSSASSAEIRPFTPAGAALDPDCPRGVPYEGGSQMLMPDVEDREALSALVRVTCDALPEKRRR